MKTLLSRVDDLERSKRATIEVQIRTVLVRVPTDWETAVWDYELGNRVDAQLIGLPLA